MNFGKAMKLVREALGMSEADFADKIRHAHPPDSFRDDFTLWEVRLAEAGEYECEWDELTLHPVAHLLGIPVSFFSLLADDNEAKPLPAIRQLVLDWIELSGKKRK